MEQDHSSDPWHTSHRLWYFIKCHTLLYFDIRGLIRLYVTGLGTGDGRRRFVESTYIFSLLLAGGCYYLSSTVNPFLYSLLSKRFRRGFHDVLRYACGRVFDLNLALSVAGGKGGGTPAGSNGIVEGTNGVCRGSGSARDTVRPQKLRVQRLRLQHAEAKTSLATAPTSNLTAATAPTAVVVINETGGSNGGPTYGVVSCNSSGAASTSGTLRRPKYKLLFVSQHRYGGEGLQQVGGGDFKSQHSTTTKSCPPQFHDAIALSEVEARHINVGSASSSRSMTTTMSTTASRSKSWRRYKRDNSSTNELETCAL
jgi:hypothetical protein